MRRAFAPLSLVAACAALLVTGTTLAAALAQRPAPPPGARLGFHGQLVLREDWAWHMKGGQLVGDARMLAPATRYVFTGCDFRAADFTAADLCECSFLGCDLRGTNLSGARLRGTRFDRATRWPAGFDPFAAGALPLDRAGTFRRTLPARPRPR